MQEDEGASPHERAADKEDEDDNYMPPSKDEASLDDDEFVVPEDPVEQETQAYGHGKQPQEKTAETLELTKTY